MAKHWKEEYFPNDYKYLGHHDLMAEDGASYKKISAKIKDIKIETVVGEKGLESKKPIVYFEEKMKPMIFNKTNCKRMQEVTGNMTGPKWIGETVIIGVEKDSYKGEIVDCLRIDTKGSENLLKKVAEITLKIKGAATKEDVMSIYNANKSIFASNMQLQKIIKEKKEAIQNPDQQTA